MDRRAFLFKSGIIAGSAWFASDVGRLAARESQPANPFKLAVISDCLTPDFESALKIMQSYRLSWVEIRNAWGKYNTEMTTEEVRRVARLLDRYQFHCSQVDTAVFKCTLPGTQASGETKTPYPYSGQIDLLKRAIERADAWRTDKVRIFSFWRVGDPNTVFDRVSDELHKAAEIAKSSGIRLLIEDEYDCNLGTGHELARMLQVLPSNVGANWDIGNGLWLGEVPYPDGYNSMDAKRIWNLHLKGVECKPDFTACAETFPDRGQIQLSDQLSALLRDRYQETLSVECEFKAPGLTQTETTKRAVAGVAKLTSSVARRIP